MNKKELQNKIEDLVNQLAELKEQINSIEIVEANSIEITEVKKSVRQKPKYGETYYFLSDGGIIVSKQWNNTFDDIFRFNIGNCFKTQQEAEEYKENILTKQELKDLALELNRGMDIDFTIPNNKYNIVYFEPSHLDLFKVLGQRNIGDIYCLNRNFLNIAKERIGAERIVKLIKSGM